MGIKVGKKYKFEGRTYTVIAYHRLIPLWSYAMVELEDCFGIRTKVRVSEFLSSAKLV